MIGGSLSADTRFYAGRFPTQYLNGDAETDGWRCSFLSNFGGPTLNAALQQDTGTSNSDRLTNNPAITGSVNDPQGIATFTAGFGATPDLQHSGRSSSERVVHIEPRSLGTDQRRTACRWPFTPHAAGDGHRGQCHADHGDLHAGYGCPQPHVRPRLGLGQRADRRPTDDQRQCRTGRADGAKPTPRSNCWGLGLTTTANASGQFTFTNVTLTVGANAFTVRATDPPGISGLRPKPLHESVLGIVRPSVQSATGR